MKLFIFLFISIFSTTIYATEELLLNDHCPEVRKEVLKYFNIKKDEGRIILLELKENQQFNKIPFLTKRYIDKIDSTHIKTISHKKLKTRSTPLPKLVELISKVSLENMNDTVTLLTSKESRRSGSKGNQETVEWIYNSFEGYGLKTEKDCFSPGLCNVFGTKKGEVDEYILVEAHLDDVGKKYAGADDNASGISALMEITRVLSPLKSKLGIIFFATNGEESGLLGSKVFVRNAKESGLFEKIKYIINMDMISYNKNGLVDIETDYRFEEEAIWVSGLVNTYTSLKPNITMPAWGSDHVPFLRAGIPGVLTIEHWKTKSPCYHQACDTADHINLEYAKEIASLNIAVTSLKAGVILD